MLQMEVPYDRRTMTVRVPDENLAGVLSGRQGEYVPENKLKGSDAKVTVIPDGLGVVVK